jgi:hypothetical protein
MTTTPGQRSLQARAAVHTSWAKTTDRSRRTAPAREAMLARFERQVDPEGVLPAAERAVRAESAKQAYFLDLSRKSAESRRRKRAARP